MSRIARSLTVALLLLGPATLSAQDGAPDARRARLLVEGEGLAITVGEVEDLIARQGVAARVRYKDPEQLKQLVTNLARAELLAGEAARRGYEKHAAVRYAVKDSAAQALVRAEIEDKITPQAIPAADVRAYYEAHPDEYHRPAMRRAAFILLPTRAQAEQLVADVKKADARGFAELAKQHSQHAATRDRGGDTGYFGKEPSGDGGDAAVPPAVRSAAFALGDVGDLSAPVEVEGQLALVRLTDERPARHVTLEDAEPSIRARLWRERRQQALDKLFAELRARAKPKVFESRIDVITFDEARERPGGFAPDPLPHRTAKDAASP